MENRTALVLVVDDEEPLATLAALFLTRAGLKTIKATSGEQALDLWTPDVDILLTDCAMPDLSGEQLALRLLDRNPALKILFMSGNTPESLDSSIPLRPGFNFIQKPFVSSELVDFVLNALRCGELVSA
jgi:two-component system cell cycle sensor histidine kinase/response regulator CckA